MCTGTLQANSLMSPGLGRRLMRLHANASRGMYLCNHGIWRMADRAAVPADAPPLDQQGNQWWPPGWGRLYSRHIAATRLRI